MFHTPPPPSRPPLAGSCQRIIKGKKEGRRKMFFAFMRCLCSTWNVEDQSHSGAIFLSFRAQIGTDYESAYRLCVWYRLWMLLTPQSYISVTNRLLCNQWRTNLFGSKFLRQGDVTGVINDHEYKFPHLLKACVFKGSHGSQFSCWRGSSFPWPQIFQGPHALSRMIITGVNSLANTAWSYIMFDWNWM